MLNNEESFKEENQTEQLQNSLVNNSANNSNDPRMHVSLSSLNGINDSQEASQNNTYIDYNSGTDPILIDPNSKKVITRTSNKQVESLENDKNNTNSQIEPFIDDQMEEQNLNTEIELDEETISLPKNNVILAKEKRSFAINEQSLIKMPNYSSRKKHIENDSKEGISKLSKGSFTEKLRKYYDEYTTNIGSETKIQTNDLYDQINNANSIDFQSQFLADFNSKESEIQNISTIFHEKIDKLKLEFSKNDTKDKKKEAFVTFLNLVSLQGNFSSN